MAGRERRCGNRNGMLIWLLGNLAFKLALTQAQIIAIMRLGDMVHILEVRRVDCELTRLRTVYTTLSTANRGMSNLSVGAGG